jgi:hypothetical protein
MDLAFRLRLRNVTFVTGDALSIEWSRFDGFYFFNPFVENPIRFSAALDETAGPAGCSGDVELLRVARRLSSLRTGSLVVSYHGIGGPLPSSYDLVLQRPAGSGCLRAWLKSRSRDEDWYHLDDHGEVSRAPQLQVERALRRFALQADVAPRFPSSEDSWYRRQCRS